MEKWKLTFGEEDTEIINAQALAQAIDRAEKIIRSCEWGDPAVEYLLDKLDDNDKMMERDRFLVTVETI